MKKIPALSLFMVVLVTMPMIGLAQNIQEANNYFRNSLSTKSARGSSFIFIVPKFVGEELKIEEPDEPKEEQVLDKKDGNKTSYNQTQADSLVKKALDLYKTKYKISRKYWWEQDSILKNYNKEIKTSIAYYSNINELTKEEDESTDGYEKAKYKGYLSLAAELQTKVGPANTEALSAFEEYKKLMKELFSKEVTSEKDIEAIKKRFDDKKVILDAKFEILKKAIDGFEKSKETLKVDLAGIEDAQKKEQLAAIPSVASALGQVTPSITLVGKSNFNSKDWYAEVRVFTGATDLKGRMENLFIPEASKAGVTVSVTKVFGKDNRESLGGAKSWGANFSMSYLSKNLERNSGSTNMDTLFTPNAFHFKLGLQKIIFNDFLSVYTNYNAIWITEGYEKIKKNFDETKGLVQFWEAGFKCYVDVNKTKNLALLLDLGFIFTNDQIKLYTKSDDRIIPNFKVGLRSSFGVR
jgi:hypothetical protein